MKFIKLLKKVKRTIQANFNYCNTVIGFGSANQGTNKVHGAPLGKEDGKTLNYLMVLIMMNSMYLKKYMKILKENN